MTSEKKSLPKIKTPAVSIGEVEPHGELFLRGLSFKGLSELTKADDSGHLPANELASRLIASLVRKADDTPLSPEAVDTLSQSGREQIISEIIERNSDWFFEDRNEKGKGIDLAKLHAPMDRGEGESDEEYLARGFRAESARLSASMSRTLSGASERMKAVLGPGLAANAGAAQRVSNLVDAMRLEPATLRIPEIPRNPIYDTNEILEEVAGQIGQMRELAAATAEMQRTLNDTATTAVADFSEGAEKTRQTTIYGLWIAAATLLVSAIAVAISIYTMQSQNADAAAREAAAKAQTERLIASEAALSRTVSDLRDELVNAREAAAKQSGTAKAGKPAR